jgi:predicted dehydrogenase
MVQNNNGSWSRARSFFIVTLLLFVVYNSNFRWLLTRDSIPARVLPFSLLLDGHLYVDEWVEPYQQGQFARGAYYVTKARGRWYSVYPIIEPIVITPLYVLPAWWLSQQHPQIAQGSFVLTTIIDTMEKMSAALIAALSAGVLYLALRKYVSPSASLAITLVYALASNTWTISSQTLWRHGFTELSFALLLWALSKDPSVSSYSLWVGLALALAAASKPVYVLVVLAFLIYFALNLHNKLFLLCVPLFLIGTAVLAYNFCFFGRVLGAYPNPLGPVMIPGGPSNPIHIPWWDGLAGLLVSPNRGLFIYTPWTLLAMWGAVRVWKENLFGWGRYLLPGMFAVYLVHARLGSWWGGGCFGPRYMTDLLPFFAFFLVPIWPRIRSSHLAMAAFILTTAVALWIQIIGAYYYPDGYWDSTPVAVEADPRRVWDWSDTQIMRTWKAGPARPDILYESSLFFQAVTSESGKPVIRIALIGLEHDHVWGMLKDIAREPAAELDAIADVHPELVVKARAQVPPTVKCYSDYIKMLDEIKPDAVIVTTATSRHLEILMECAKRHIHFATESPMAATTAEAREMESLASAAKIKLMVNYWNAWVAPSQELHGRILGGAIGPVQKIVVQYGHEGPRAIGVSKNFADEPYDPVKDGGGALMDFGSYGAEWALWLKGRPSSVFAYSLKLKTGQSNDLDDDAVILLKYPDATATIQASWDWPFTQGQVQAFGPKGSFLATKDALYFQAARAPTTIENPEGRSVELPFVLHETSSAIAYFVYHIRHDELIEDPVSARLNVEVAEILDAAKESLRTGRAVELPEP